jgi:AraC family L-rhamnose operon regulatory protein RhaS
MHHLNDLEFSYEKGDIFLLGPEDYHHFVIGEETEFSFVRFNESLQKHGDLHQDRLVVNTLLSTSSQSRGSIVTDPQEKHKLFQLLDVLEAEVSNDRSQYYELVKDGIMRTMLVLLARNLFNQADENRNHQQAVERILMYIKQNIFYPQNLTIEHLADTFHYSPNYISIFFKRQTGESLKKYIIRIKIGLIESRLKNGNLSLNDIAFEFGYTDESHLCKQFRQYTGKSPRSFRNRKEMVAMPAPLL